MTEDDVIVTVATDSAEMYQSRLNELLTKRGKYSALQAAIDYNSCIQSQSIDYLKELSYTDRKAIHNLKYFTWVEQQQKDVADLNQLWYDREILGKLFAQVDLWDDMNREFNERTGLV